MAGTSRSATIVKKVVARVALLGLDAGTSAILRESFKQFGIETCEFGHAEIARLDREKLEGCVLRLDEPEAEVTLRAVRTSRSNRRMVVYGLCQTAQEALRFSKYGINAMLKQPLERQEAIKVVRFTHLLVIHELRCYVRVPLMTEVTVETSRKAHRGTTLEISGGGMSMRGETLPPLGEKVQVKFDLPNRPGMDISAIVCWAREHDHMFGVRFEAGDSRRLPVKDWIDEYLEIV